MLITGIRHKIASELDSSRSAAFMRYLAHYLQMFACLGIVIPVLIVVDYFNVPQTKEEVVVNKFYQITNGQHQIKYHIYTDSYHFVSDATFYENTNIDAYATLVRTPIFKTVTSVISYVDRIEYKCNPHSIYGWPIIIAILTLIFSVILIIKTWSWIRKHKHIKYDKVINLGIINAMMCAFIIVAVFFRILN